MLFFYNILLVFLSVVSSPFLLYKLIFDKRYRIGLSERLGILPPDLLSQFKDSGPVWFHAASVGEVIASVSLLERIRERWPERKLLVSTFTPTGNKAAREKLLARGEREGGRRIADEVIFLPLDLPIVVGRVLKRVNPSMLILMETELWPNLVSSAGRRGIPVVVVNGRISDRSYGKYRFISPLLRKVFGNIEMFLMQSEGDAKRIITLGADPVRVSVTGNIKFDMEIKDRDIPFMNEWGGPVFIAGSTRTGEDSLLLGVYRALRDKHQGLKLVLAPRHLERIGEVEGILQEKGLQYARRSRVSDRIGAPVLLLDTLGELTYFYKYGDVVFIGGSLVEAGGHNPIEPAFYGKPVLFGPHMENFREIAEALVDSGGGIKVDNADELNARIDRLLSDIDLCSSVGERGREAVMRNKGATGRTVSVISGLLGQALLPGYEPKTH